MSSDTDSGLFAKVAVNQNVALAKACSQIDSLFQHVAADVAVEFVLGHNFDPSADQPRQTLRQCQTLAEHVVPARKVHQEVHVTIGPFLAASDGAEYTNVPCPVLTAEGKNGVSLDSQGVEQHCANLAQPYVGVA